MWTIDNNIFQQYGADGLASMDHYMNLLYDLLIEHEIKMTIAVYPWPAQIFYGDVDSVHAAHWREWAQAHGLPFHNYFRCFIDPSIP